MVNPITPKIIPPQIPSRFASSISDKACLPGVIAVWDELWAAHKKTSFLVHAPKN